jgi:hypothetical protein
MPPREQEVVRELLDALIIKSQITGTLERVTQGATKDLPIHPQTKT